MDNESFEELSCDTKTGGDSCKWLSEGGEVSLVTFNGKVIEMVVSSPKTFQIIETEPNVKGNTAQGHTKPAKLDCGVTISVPGYLEVGDKIRVDTKKGEYIEREK